MFKKNLLFIFISLTVYGCNSAEYSPNQKFNSSTPINVNNREISELPLKPAGSTIKIAVSGDTQRSYKESQDFVNLINSRNDVDFVVLNGDISDFGLLLEFNGVYKIYNGLKVPFITVIGNHDLVANGSDVYRRMFGELNFTFNYAGIKFICHDTNGREYDFNGRVPDMNWLKRELIPGPGTNRMIAFSHVPPNDADFDPKLANAYESLFNSTPHLLASIHSHQHSKLTTFYQNGNGIPFFITNAIVNRAFTLFTITNDQVSAQEIDF